MLRPVDRNQILEFEYEGVKFQLRPSSQRERLEYLESFGDVIDDGIRRMEEAIRYEALKEEAKKDAEKCGVVFNENSSEFRPEPRPQAEDAKTMLRVYAAARWYVERCLLGWTGWTYDGKPVLCEKDRDGKPTAAALDLLDFDAAIAISRFVQQSANVKPEERKN